jgi:hypothetical protein
VQCFGDSLFSHEEYLHVLNWRAVNKCICGEPQSQQSHSYRKVEKSGEATISLFSILLKNAVMVQLYTTSGQQD